jgi:hypothetical protein
MPRHTERGKQSDYQQAYELRAKHCTPTGTKYVEDMKTGGYV